MILSVQGVGFGYTKKPLLQRVSFSVKKGDSLCLLGPNGTGKTTLLRCILGVNKFSVGQILLNGKDIRKMPIKEIAQTIAYVPQASSVVFPYTVLDMVVMGRNPHIHHLNTPSTEDWQIARDSLEILGISYLAESQFGEISGGERQMALIARALTQQSQLLVMDEPTASLDYGNQVRILGIINQLVQQGYSVVMTSHFPNHAFLACNQVVLLKDGVVRASGDPEEIVTELNLSDLYGTRIKVVTVDITEEDFTQVKVCVPILSTSTQ